MRLYLLQDQQTGNDGILTIRMYGHLFASIEEIREFAQEHMLSKFDILEFTHTYTYDGDRDWETRSMI